MSVDIDRAIAESGAPESATATRLDVRELGPPKPLTETLELLETMDEAVLVQLNDRALQHLYPKLEERGYVCETTEIEGVTVTTIWEE